VISIESVTRKYGAFTAVDDVSFTADAGRVTGFLGPNGAGKSTTMRIVVGLTRARSGTATISGRRQTDPRAPAVRSIRACGVRSQVEDVCAAPCEHTGGAASSRSVLVGSGEFVFEFVGAGDE
jgi:ABC-type Na+ transport system ATPase subunit NatA